MTHADRFIDCTKPLEAGSSIPLAISLYREAAYWALITHAGEATADLSEAFEKSPLDFSDIGLSPVQLSQARAALIGKAFIQTADDNRGIQNDEADACRAFVHALLDGYAREDAVEEILFQRWYRMALLFLLFCVSIVVAIVAINRTVFPDDLADNKPWRASSEKYECHPEKRRCADARTKIFFHTQREDNPWLEIDLEKRRLFNRIEIKNRDDCCQDRAIPLVVEVSNDAETWSEIASRSTTFRTWEVYTELVYARYLRLRVNRRTSLQLVRVRVWKQ